MLQANRLFSALEDIHKNFQKTLVKVFTIVQFLTRSGRSRFENRGDSCSLAGFLRAMRLLRTILISAVLAGAPMLAFGQDAPLNQAEGGTTKPVAEHVEKGIPQSAQPLGAKGSFVTNSMIVTWIVALGLIVFAQVATRNMKEVPSGAQNFWEWLVESLYEFLESVLGPSLVKTTFWFLATIFIFILFTNWFGLLPGVGTIGWGVPKENGSLLLTEVSRPLFRGGNADLNMPLAMAMIFFLLWIIWAFQANGVKGVFLHIFGPKGEITGAIKYFMIVIFFLVGFIEILSISFRPIALTFRLYGNIFAGENLLEAMSNVVQHPAWAKAVFSALLPVPFYFMELLVGFVQALVFMLLCAVFTGVMCTHEEEPGKEHH
jgi:F-type H+-transporting ATPase subunit a